MNVPPVHIHPYGCMMWYPPHYTSLTELTWVQAIPLAQHQGDPRTAAAPARPSHGTPCQSDPIKVFQEVANWRRDVAFEQFLLNQASNTSIVNAGHTTLTLCQCPWPGSLQTEYNVSTIRHAMDWDGLRAICVDEGLETRPKFTQLFVAASRL